MIKMVKLLAGIRQILRGLGVKLQQSGLLKALGSAPVEEVWRLFTPECQIKAIYPNLISV